MIQTDEQALEFRVTVIINNRDLLSWPKKMREDIKRMAGLHEIIIIDNDSNNKELLAWYKDIPDRVLFVQNLGHRAPWAISILDSIETDLYVVTDSDLDLSNLPDDTLQKLAHQLFRFPHLGKVGLSLATDNTPKDSPYFTHVENYEAHIQSRVSEETGLLEAPVDTTFAIYDRRILREYMICGQRMPHPYTARHIPWEVVEPTEEFLYYLNRADHRSSSYKWFTKHASRSSLQGLYKSHTTGKVSTKWASYFSIYESHIGKLKHTEVALLEIGVQNGGSLDIWAKYFKQGQIFVGCDANTAVQKLNFEDDRIKIVTGVSWKPETVSKIALLGSAGYDIIIDDGSHTTTDTIFNFLTLFQLLKPGGFYIIEDMHCAYWPEYGGGYHNARSVCHFLTQLTHLVNIEHKRNSFSTDDLFATFIGQSRMEDFIGSNSVYSIEFYNSMYVITKSSNEQQPLLGDVVIAGTVADIDARVLPKN